MDHPDTSLFDSTLSSSITLEELNNILHTTKNSALGSDNIPNKLIKELPPIGINHLLKIFNCIWQHQVFPDNWRKAIVIPIPKPSKNKTKPESYRPITLTSCICRPLEKIINRTLRWFLESNNILSPNPHEFRQYRSITDVLINLKTNICEAF